MHSITWLSVQIQISERYQHWNKSLFENDERWWWWRNAIHTLALLRENGMNVRLLTQPNSEKDSSGWKERSVLMDVGVVIITDGLYEEIWFFFSSVLWKRPLRRSSLLIPVNLNTNTCALSTYHASCCESVCLVNHGKLHTIGSASNMNLYGESVARCSVFPMNIKVCV